MNITIISNDDDTVTLEAPGVRVHIAHSNGRKAANGIALTLRNILQDKEDLSRAKRHARHIIDSVRELGVDAARIVQLVESGP
jgi:hypothetical protein